MEKRYELFASMGMRNVDGYNAHVEQYNRETGENNPTLPYIVANRRRTCGLSDGGK